MSGDEEREIVEDHEERLEGLKQEKASVKASFTRARRQLLELIVGERFAKPTSSPRSLPKGGLGARESSFSYEEVG